jgi:hypothetical protein
LLKNQSKKNRHQDRYSLLGDAEVEMTGELLVGVVCVIGAFSAFLLLTFFSLRRVNRIKKKGLTTLREIKRGLARNERTR